MKFLPKQNAAHLPSVVSHKYLANRGELFMGHHTSTIIETIGFLRGRFLRVSCNLNWTGNLIRFGFIVLLAVFSCSIGDAQSSYTNSQAGATLIYSNAFNGIPANISNTPPNYAVTLFGGSNNAVWIDAGGSGDTNAFYANGTVGTGQGDTILLPFNAQSNQVYTLTATVDMTASPGSWVSCGYAQNYSIPGIANSAPNGGGLNSYAWTLRNFTGNTEFFAGAAGGNGVYNATPAGPVSAGTYTYTQILNTTSNKWVTTAFFNGVQLGLPYAYGSAPSIGAVGLGQHALSTPGNYRWTSLMLFANQLALLQEPASANVDESSAFTNTVQAAGTPPFFYQWYNGGLAISGATNANLVLNPVLAGDASANYYVIVTNVYGAVTSSPSLLTVSSSLAFSPVPPANVVYLSNGTLTIPVTAFGTPPVGYYWTNLTSGVVLGSGSSEAVANLNATLTISNAPAGLSGDELELVVTNATGSTNCFTTLFSPPVPITLSYTNAVLYSNDFDGGTWTIAGMPVTAANSLVGGTNTTWIDALGTNDTGSMLASGVDASSLGDSWLLPFTPHSGYVYTLTATLTFIGDPGNWIGLGFAQNAPINAAVGYGRLTDGGTTPPEDGPNGYDWVILTDSSGNVQQFAGAGGGNQTADVNGGFSAGPGTHTVQVVLDTTGAQWVMAAYVDGVQMGTNYRYSANPPIGAVGITQNTLSAPGNLQWDDLMLSQASPGGVPPYLLSPLPPGSVLLTNSTVTIAATAYGSAPLGYYWTFNNSTVLASGATNNLSPLNAGLSVPSSSLGNGQLELTVTNAYGSTNIFVAVNVFSNYTSTVNPGSVLVTNFQGWGTSLQWWANVVGAYPNRANYVNLLFNTLKLNVVRYEIGGGQNPAVNNPNTPYKAMMQGFELTNGIWNWNADVNQRWVLQQAEANGANLVEAFAVSAPWWMCVSSNVDGNMAGTNNLQVDCETNFAVYLSTVVSNLTVLDGDHFDYVIPMNEPSLGTVGQETNGYETCHMSNDQQQRVINDLRAQLNSAAPSVGVDAPGDYDEYEAYNDLTEYSATTLGNLALFSTHSYIQNDPSRLSAEAASQQKPLWVEEYGDSDSTGLTMAQHIHDDITGMQVPAWIYWMAVNSDAGNAFLYNGLAAPNPGYSTNYIIYEKFYAMGQFSEFVRPGCEIISVNDSYTLAAYNPANSSLALVTVNTNNSSFGVTYNLSGFGVVPWQTVAGFQTSTSESMVALPVMTIANSQFTAVIPPKSVTTFLLAANPALAFTRINGNGMTLNWNFGVLQTATNIAGPFLDMTNAVPPFVISPTNAQQFFRIREN